MMVDFQRDPDNNLKIEDMLSSTMSLPSEDNKKLQSTPSSSQGGKKAMGSSISDSKHHSNDHDVRATRKSTPHEADLDHMPKDVSHLQQEPMLNHQSLVKSFFAKQKAFDGGTTTENKAKNRPTNDNSLALSFCGLSVKEESGKDKGLGWTHAALEDSAVSSSSSVSVPNADETVHALVGRHHDSIAHQSTSSSPSSPSTSTRRMMDLHSHQSEEEARVKLCALLAQRSRNENATLSPSQRQQLLQLQHDIFRGSQPLAPTIAATIRRNQQQSSGSSSSRTTRKAKQRYAKSA
jgi:hypothetical protein